MAQEFMAEVLFAIAFALQVTLSFVIIAPSFSNLILDGYNLSSCCITSLLQVSEIVSVFCPNTA
jgi:hypothetical protein